MLITLGESQQLAWNISCQSMAFQIGKKNHVKLCKYLEHGLDSRYWGWGGEDDDLYERCKLKNLDPKQLVLKIGRFKVIKIISNKIFRLNFC